MKNTINKMFFVSLAIFAVFAFGTIQANAQTQKTNSNKRSFETEQPPVQPTVIEVPVSKSEVIIGSVVTTVITVCDQFNRCRKILNIVRGILGGNSQPPSPQMFNRPVQRWILRGGGWSKSPF